MLFSIIKAGGLYYVFLSDWHETLMRAFLLFWYLLACENQRTEKSHTIELRLEVHKEFAFYQLFVAVMKPLIEEEVKKKKEKDIPEEQDKGKIPVDSKNSGKKSKYEGIIQSKSINILQNYGKAHH